jgi:hypothetical protein
MKIQLDGKDNIFDQAYKDLPENNSTYKTPESEIKKIAKEINEKVTHDYYKKPVFRIKRMGDEFENESYLEKGGKHVPIGTVAQWADGKSYRKVSDSKWEAVDGGKTRSEKPSGSMNEKQGKGWGDDDASTPAKLHEKFRIFMENMSKEHRSIFINGKMDFEKKTYTAPNGQVALKYENNKVHVVKVGNMQKAKDTTKLIKKTIINKKGQQQTVYVKPVGAKTDSSWLDKFSGLFGFKQRGEAMKKLETDYKQNGIGEKFGLTWDGWKDHVAEYMKNKDKWSAFFNKSKPETPDKKPGESKPKVGDKEKKAKPATVKLSVMKLIHGLYGNVQPGAASEEPVSVSKTSENETQRKFENPENDKKDILYKKIADKLFAETAKLGFKEGGSETPKLKKQVIERILSKHGIDNIYAITSRPYQGIFKLIDIGAGYYAIKKELTTNQLVQANLDYENSQKNIKPAEPAPDNFDTMPEAEEKSADNVRDEKEKIRKNIEKIEKELLSDVKYVFKNDSEYKKDKYGNSNYYDPKTKTIYLASEMPFLKYHEEAHKLFDKIQPVSIIHIANKNSEFIKEFVETATGKSHFERDKVNRIDNNKLNVSNYDWIEALPNLWAEYKTGRLKNKSNIENFLNEIMSFSLNQADNFDTMPESEEARVIKDLEDGKDVPDEILDKYPQLRAKYRPITDKEAEKISEKAMQRAIDEKNKFSDEKMESAFSELISDLSGKNPDITPQLLERKAINRVKEIKNKMESTTGRNALQGFIEKKEAEYNKKYGVEQETRPDETPEQKAVDEKTAEAINEATPETRNKSEREITGVTAEAAEKVEIPSAPFQPDVTPLTIPFYKGGEERKFDAMDFTKVVSKDIYLVKEKRILEQSRPAYIPELDEDFVWGSRFMPPIMKLAENKYVIKTHTERFGTSSAMSRGENKYAIVTRDVLAATIDYYIKKAKAKQKKEKEDYKARTGYELRAKRISIISDSKMTYDQSNFMNSFTGATRTNWDMYKEIRQDLKQKTEDMEIQIEEYENTHAKGRETAYGDAGVKNNLLDEYGVKVKRQNGSEITDQEIEEIKDAIETVYSAFGDRSSMAKNFGLKISHSGDVLMHARKAVGLFIPRMKAIGVSAKYGDDEFGFTLSHEWGHFMDYYVGDKNGKHYVSDDPDHIAGKIAETFRKNMKNSQKSKYQTRTCECFARAMEQYWGVKIGKPLNNMMGNHPTDEVFKEKVMPLIDQFLTENNELLKASQDFMFVKKYNP